MTQVAEKLWTNAIEDRKSLLGTDSVARMAAIFLEELQGLLSAAQNSVAKNDWDNARKAFHHLSASAGALDFAELSEQAQRAERACLNADHALAVQSLECLTPIATACGTLLRSHFQLP